MDPKQKVKIELTVDQVNFILGKLSKLPFEEVNILISQIVNQANEQVEK